MKQHRRSVVKAIRIWVLLARAIRVIRQPKAAKMPIFGAWCQSRTRPCSMKMILKDPSALEAASGG